METKENNEVKVNIADILRYAPKMLELFSPIYGEVYFDYVNEEGTDIHVKTKLCGGSVATFNANGTFYNLPNSECLLFPSVNHRCWNNWQNTLFLESIGSVCVDTITGNKFILGEDGTYFSDNTGNSYHFLIDDEDSGNYLLNSRYASPEETKEFFEELEKNGYKWNGKKVVKKEVVPHKFKVGDWIITKDKNVHKDYSICKIVEIENNRYHLENGDYLDINTLEQYNYCLWTIQDAKDGDVLACGDKVTDCPFIFHNLTEDLNPRSYCGFNTSGDFQYNDENGGFWCKSDEVRPATKEQRDLLFQKMKEAGYVWDADKKELKKIHVIDDGKAEMDYCFTKMMAGEKANPTWNVEDSSKVQRICKYLNEAKKYYADITEVRECIDWLKSLKERLS